MLLSCHQCANAWCRPSFLLRELSLIGAACPFIQITVVGGGAPEAKQIVKCLRASNPLRAHLDAIIQMTAIIKHWEYSHLPLGMFDRKCERGFIT